MPRTEDRPLDGQVAIVTGASRGIGAAIAQRLADRGATVAVTARTEHGPGASSRLPGSLEETAAMIEEDGGRAFTVVADLARPADRASLVEAVLGRLGRVDILVNNAAVTFFEPVSRMAESRLELMLEVQVRAPLDLARRVLPGMRGRQRGWILNISSLAARHPEGPPYPGWAAAGGLYGACKAALERLTTGLAAEVIDDRIAVNALSPAGVVATPNALLNGLVPEDPAGLESEEHFASAAYMLCGGSSSFLTGHVTTSTALLRYLGLEEG
ncbi:MAG: citronellol/citronellal dehydrogenase [Frankiales bacterium]|nr:citronellol/citronellal dehydrogenase [Frankiales bacterium]